MMRTWTIRHVFVLAAVILFVIAFCIAINWFGHNWFAWFTAGSAAFAASHLPWRTGP